MARVFICYRSMDQVEAIRLHDEIAAAGHEVWMDIYEIGTGDSIIGSINAGLSNARYLVLCLSVHGLDSAWVASEWMSTLARQIEGQNVKILPVRLTGGELPAILADRRIADLVKDWNGQLKDLLRAMK